MFFTYLQTILLRTFEILLHVYKIDLIFIINSLFKKERKSILKSPLSSIQCSFEVFGNIYWMLVGGLDKMYVRLILQIGLLSIFFLRCLIEDQVNVPPFTRRFSWAVRNQTEPQLEEVMYWFELTSGVRWDVWHVTNGKNQNDFLLIFVCFKMKLQLIL